jgi:hypothetical protein
LGRKRHVTVDARQDGETGINLGRSRGDTTNQYITALPWVMYFFPYEGDEKMRASKLITISTVAVLMGGTSLAVGHSLQSRESQSGASTQAPAGISQSNALGSETRGSNAQAAEQGSNLQGSRQRGQAMTTHQSHALAGARGQGLSTGRGRSMETTTGLSEQQRMRHGGSTGGYSERGYGEYGRPRIGDREYSELGRSHRGYREYSPHRGYREYSEFSRPHRGYREYSEFNRPRRGYREYSEYGRPQRGYREYSEYGRPDRGYRERARGGYREYGRPDRGYRERGEYGQYGRQRSEYGR